MGTGRETALVDMTSSSPDRTSSALSAAERGRACDAREAVNDKHNTDGLKIIQHMWNFQIDDYRVDEIRQGDSQLGLGSGFLTNPQSRLEQIREYVHGSQNIK